MMADGAKDVQGTPSKQPDRVERPLSGMKVKAPGAVGAIAVSKEAKMPPGDASGGEEATAPTPPVSPAAGTAASSLPAAVAVAEVDALAIM